MTVDMVEELTRILVKWELLLNDKVGQDVMDSILSGREANAAALCAAFEALDAELARLEKDLEQIEDGV